MAFEPAAGSRYRVRRGTREGLEMWDRVTPADIKEARAQLSARRDAILARQAAEVQAIEADAVQIDALTALVEGFVARFKAPASEPSAPATAVLVAKKAEPRGDDRLLAVAGF